MEGAYVQVTPIRSTVDLIRRLMRVASPLPYIGDDNLHCTLIYDPKGVESSGFTVEKGEALLQKEPMRASPMHVEAWDDHKNRKILVLKLASSDIYLRHIFWKQQGLRHSYPVFNAHVTLTDSITDPELIKSVQNYVSLLNAYLPMDQKLLFNNETLHVPKPQLAKPFERLEKLAAKNGVPKMRMPLIPLCTPGLTKREEEAIDEHGFNVHSDDVLLKEGLSEEVLGKK